MYLTPFPKILPDLDFYFSRMSNSKPYDENRRGRKFVNGQSCSNDVRNLIITALIEKGADEITGKVPRGVYTQVAQQLMVSNSTVTNIWNIYCCYGSVDPLPHAGGKPRKLGDQEVQYIEFLKRERPSVSLNEMQRRLEQNANVTVSAPVLSRTLNHRLSDGTWTYKKLVRTAKERFTVPNLRYTQAYVDVLHQRNPYKLIFFDEAGFKLPDVGNPTHGHAPVGHRAVEIQSRVQTRNMTLNLAVGLCGLYADVVCGASNTQNYLEFWDDAATYGENFDDTAFLSAGNTVVVDNCATHRNAGGRALSHFLQNIGVDYVFTPSYSPDMNVAEFVFGKLKCLMKAEPYRTMCRENMENAIFNVLAEITANDIRGFFRKVGYLNV